MILVIGEKLNIMWICALTVAKLHLNVFKIVWYFAFCFFVFWYDDLLFLHSGQQFQWSHHTHKVQMSKQCPWSCHTQKFRWGNSYHAHIIHANLDEWTVSMVAPHTHNLTEQVPWSCHTHTEFRWVNSFHGHTTHTKFRWVNSFHGHITHTKFRWVNSFHGDIKFRWVNSFHGHITHTKFRWVNSFHGHIAHKVQMSEQFPWLHHTHKVQMNEQFPWLCHTQRSDEWTVSMVVSHTKVRWARGQNQIRWRRWQS